MLPRPGLGEPTAPPRREPSPMRRGTAQFPRSTSLPLRLPRPRASSPAFPESLVSGLFPAASIFQSRSVVVGCPGSGSPVPAQGRHHRGVDGELSSPPESQPVSHDFQPQRRKQPGPCRERTCWTSPERRLPCTSVLQRAPEESLDSPTPASEHAAQWWPNWSSRWPHRQVR